MNLSVNGSNQVVEAPGDTKLLWVIREHLRLTGTKYGCGLGLCGACTVHMNGEAVRSCQIELSDAEGTQITTIGFILKRLGLCTRCMKCCSIFSVK